MPNSVDVSADEVLNLRVDRHVHAREILFANDKDLHGFGRMELKIALERSDH